jgi:hypothetical protein
VLCGISFWIRRGDGVVGPAAAAYARLPGLSPPWLVHVTWAAPTWVKSVMFAAVVALASAAGLLVGVLVRPKNRAADLAAGAATGFVFGATAMTVSGWCLGVVMVAVDPVEKDLEALAEAAWAEPAPAGRRPAERLLEEYPDLRKLPARERGKVFYWKIHTDLLAGIPLGIWLGALLVVAWAVPTFTVQALAAGPLLRRHGPRPGVLPPYLERALPVTVLLTLGLGFVLVAALMARRFDARPVLVWFLPGFGLLALAVAAAWRDWPWPLRLVLHVGWLLAVGAAAVLLRLGVIAVRYY